MATAETEQGTLDEPAPLDRVLLTAEDRPANGTLPALADPAADHEDAALSARRLDVEEKHRRVVAFLDATQQDALVLGRVDSIAWFTSGGDLGQALGAEFGAVLLYINRGSRAVITDNVQSARVFEEELAGLGFQLKERSWFEDPSRVIAELGHRKRIASDLDELPSPWPRPGDPLRSLRYPLTPVERQRLRELGRTLSLAVEATCRNFDQGETEAAVAGHLAHRLIREGVVPADLRVASDGRLERYRQAIFKAAPIRKRATVTVTGRRHGLCASLTRTVSFGAVDRALRECHGVAAMVDATCIFFSRPGEKVASVFRRARRIYEKYNHPHEWTLDYIGSLIGYAPREAILLPDSDFTLRDGMALAWSPSIGAARSEDTVVLEARGYEVVTEAQNWPKIEVVVKGFNMTRPGVLER